MLAMMVQELNTETLSAFEMVTHLKETFQNQGKGKGKGKRKGNAVAGETKPAAKPNPQPAKKTKPTKDAVCFFCQKPGHWKRNCKLYMEDLKKEEERRWGLYFGYLC